MAWVRCCGGTKKEKFALDFVSTRSNAVLQNNVITDAIPQGGLTGNEHLALITFTANDNFVLSLTRFVRGNIEVQFRVYDQNSTMVFSRSNGSVGSYAGTGGVYTVYLWNTSADGAGWLGNVEYNIA